MAYLFVIGLIWIAVVCIAIKVASEFAAEIITRIMTKMKKHEERGVVEETEPL